MKLIREYEKANEAEIIDNSLRMGEVLLVVFAYVIIGVLN